MTDRIHNYTFGMGRIPRDKWARAFGKGDDNNVDEVKIPRGDIKDTFHINDMGSWEPVSIKQDD